VRFHSARQALRASVALQAAFREPVEGGAALPLGVGIGLDAGEAVAVEQGYRGAALNRAARLCAAAAGGEVLASEALVEMAGPIDGLSYGAVRALRLKGYESRVRAVRVSARSSPPPPAPAAARTRRRPSVRLAGMAVLLVAAAAAAVLLGTRRPSDSASDPAVDPLRHGGVVRIDERTGRRRDVVSLDERSAAASGTTPALAHGAAADQHTIWISTSSGLVAIDARHPHRARLRLRFAAAGRVARAGDAVWLVGGPGNNTDAAAEISYVNPADGQIDLHRSMSNVQNTNVIAASRGAVWLAAARGLLRIKPGGSINSFLDIPHVVGRLQVVAGQDADSIAVGDGALWAASPEQLPTGSARLGAVVRIDLRRSHLVSTIPVPDVRGVAVGPGPSGREAPTACCARSIHASTE
jgi:hypothetical protein